MLEYSGETHVIHTKYHEILSNKVKWCGGRPTSDGIQYTIWVT